MNAFSSDRSDSPEQGGSNRREFLRNGVLTLGGLALPAVFSRAAMGAATGLSVAAAKNKSVIFIYLMGGPSQLDMYDMKPNAPVDIRGEFRPINTNVPGVRVCEHLPLHAKIADKFAIVHGVETLDTHSSAVVMTGYSSSAKRFGLHEIDSVQIRTPALPYDDWDSHGRVLGRELSIFAELRDKLPVYDAAIHGLITSTYECGLDKDVLIVACGEFGRTPWINEFGGRNHWAPSGSVLFAGGGLRMGQAIGYTGPIGEREQARSRPYTAQNVLATIYRHLGIDPAKTIVASDGKRVSLLGDCQPISELI